MLKDLHGRLRPMGLSDMLDETAEIFKSNFVLLAGVAGAIYVPYVILSGLIQAPSRPPMEAVAASMVDGAIAFFISSIITGALAYAISERYLAREASVGGSYRWVFQSGLLWRLIGATLLKTLIIAGPVMLGVGIAAAAAAMAGFGGGGSSAVVFVLFAALFGLAGVVMVVALGVRLVLVEPALVIERCGVTQAISRSWQLLAGRFWPTLGVLIVVGIVVMVVSGILVMPGGMSMGLNAARHAEIGWGVRVLNMVLTGIAHVLTTPLMSIVAILLYYDARIRKEGFDLELLARELDEKSQLYTGGGASSLPQETPIPPPLAVEPPPSESESPQ